MIAEICTKCDEPISAGETVIWMPGINARGPAYPRCTFLTDLGRGQNPAISRTAPAQLTRKISRTGGQ